VGTITISPFSGLNHCILLYCLIDDLVLGLFGYLGYLGCFGLKLLILFIANCSVGFFRCLTPKSLNGVFRRLGTAVRSCFGGGTLFTVPSAVNTQQDRVLSRSCSLTVRMRRSTYLLNLPCLTPRLRVQNHSGSGCGLAKRTDPMTSIIKSTNSCLVTRRILAQQKRKAPVKFLVLRHTASTRRLPVPKRRSCSIRGSRFSGCALPVRSRSRCNRTYQGWDGDSFSWLLDREPSPCTGHSWSASYPRTPESASRPSWLISPVV